MDTQYSSEFSRQLRQIIRQDFNPLLNGGKIEPPDRKLNRLVLGGNRWDVWLN